MSATVAVVLGAGAGTRTGRAVNKALLHIGDEPMVVSASRAFVESRTIDELVVVAAPDEVVTCSALLAANGISTRAVIPGGATRHSSEWAALSHLAEDIDEGKIGVVLIHDAARPFFSGERLAELVEAARLHEGAIFAVPVEDNLARLHEGNLQGWMANEDLWSAQTPQAFDASTLLDAYRRARSEGFEGTDTSATVERAGVRPVVLRGDPGNVKVTYPEDVVLSERLWESRRKALQ